MAEKRFVKVYAGGLTVLLDRDGKPVVSPLPLPEEK